MDMCLRLSIPWEVDMGGGDVLAAAITGELPKKKRPRLIPVP